MTANGSFTRTEMLLGADGMEALRRAHVAVFGIGGVGSYAAEALARAGVGRLTFIDGDTIAESNINRQIHADTTTVGLRKAEVMAARVRRINPQAEVRAVNAFASADDLPVLLAEKPGFVVDAIDTITVKIALAMYCRANGIPAISSMGMANKLYPEKITIGDLYDTSVCPLARVMRTELRKRGLPQLPVCYSTEPARTPHSLTSEEAGKRPLGSVSFVPAAAGLMLAGYVVRKLSVVD